jgi:hypothetical protein
VNVRVRRQSGHTLVHCKCPLMTQSGHRLVRCTCLLLTQSGHHISRWNASYSSRLAGAAFVARHPRYSVAVGGEDGSRVSSGTSSEDGPEGLSGDTCSRCRSIMKSRKHSIGTKYLRSAEENFVRKETRTLLPSWEYRSALNATTLIDEASFWLMPLRFNSILLYRPQVDRPLE